MFALLIHGLGQLGHATLDFRLGAELVVALACMALLVKRERNRSAPILPVDLFRNSGFTLSSATAVFAFTTRALALVALPFVFHHNLDRSQAEIGLLIAPWPITGAFMAPIAGSLSDRIPAGLLGAVGLCCLAAGISVISMLHPDASTLSVMLGTMLCGFGFGLFLSPNQNMIMSSAPAGRSGSASGVLGTARLLGQAAGAAIVSLGLSLSSQNGGVAVLWAGAGFALIGAMLSALRLLRKSEGS